MDNEYDLWLNMGAPKTPRNAIKYKIELNAYNFRHTHTLVVDCSKHKIHSLIICMQMLMILRLYRNHSLLNETHPGTEH